MTITFHIGDNQAAETAMYDERNFVLQPLNLTFP